MNFLMVILLAVSVLWQSCSCQLIATTPAQYLNAVKCFFVVFGEYSSYDEAKAVCQFRNATLAFFASTSEENAIRNSIDWRKVPGYVKTNAIYQSSDWEGQLWLGTVKRSNIWVWDNPFLPNISLDIGIPWMKTPMQNYVYIPQLIIPQAFQENCAVARSTGWITSSCSVTNRFTAGSLCTKITRAEPSSQVLSASDNFCGVPLLPGSSFSQSLSLPMVIRKHYMLVKGEFNYIEATIACQRSGAIQLATSRSEIEYDYIKNNLDFSTVSNQAWLGLSRPSPTQPFTWVDMVPNGFTGPFFSGQPDVNSGECVGFDFSGNRLGWRTYNCETQRMSALCEDFKFI